MRGTESHEKQLSVGLVRKDAGRTVTEMPCDCFVNHPVSKVQTLENLVWAMTYEASFLIT